MTERQPPRTYEVTWQSGHIETVLAHQVSWPNGPSLFGLPRLSGGKPERIQFHAEIDGMWTLQLSALEEDIRTVRDVTNAERIGPTA